MDSLLIISLFSFFTGNPYIPVCSTSKILTPFTFPYLCLFASEFVSWQYILLMVASDFKGENQISLTTAHVKPFNGSPWIWNKCQTLYKAHTSYTFCLLPLSYRLCEALHLSHIYLPVDFQYAKYFPPSESLHFLFFLPG